MSHHRWQPAILGELPAAPEEFRASREADIYPLQQPELADPPHQPRDGILLYAQRGGQLILSLLDSQAQILERCQRKRTRLDPLLNETVRDPFPGTGKSEPLVGNLSGHWSRRIDQVNRLVYRADDNDVAVLACRNHYGD